MAAEAEAARNKPPPVPQLRTQDEQMEFLVSDVQGKEKNIEEILQSQKSLERVVETKFHNMDVKVTELTTTVRQLQHEVNSMEIPCSDNKDEHDDDDEDESPPPTTTRFSTRPRSGVVRTHETEQPPKRTLVKKSGVKPKPSTALSKEQIPHTERSTAAKSPTTA
ncbi:hypothetical protein D1007_37973 [Hordeum vulgare]|nr:hypothetical protein D1007_37973 [Hordeum vulgare]